MPHEALFVWALAGIEDAQISLRGGLAPSRSSNLALPSAAVSANIEAMRTLVAVAALLFALGAASGSDPDTGRQITDLNGLLQIATKHYDVETVSKWLSDDYVLVNGAGDILNRPATLKDVGDRSQVWIANEPSDVTVRSYNGDCAILVDLLHLKYRYAGKVHDVLARITEVWVKENGVWRYASAQATVYKRFS